MRYILALAITLSLGTSECTQPTTARVIEQRQVPFFTMLVIENLSMGGMVVTVLLFEDEAGNCYMGYNVDGGIALVPPSTCEAARKPALEPK